MFAEITRLNTKKKMKKYLYLLFVALFSCIAISIKAQTPPIKQTVDGYFFNRGFKNSITKVELYLENDYVVGYSNNGSRTATQRKLKIKKNPKANPSKVSDPMADIYNHSYMGYFAYWGSSIVYFDLNKPVEIRPEIPLDAYEENEVDKKPLVITNYLPKELERCLMSDFGRYFARELKSERPNEYKVVANYIIDKEGKVIDVYVIESSNHSLDEAFACALKKTLNKYQIKPAVRDGKEVGFKGKFMVIRK